MMNPYPKVAVQEQNLSYAQQLSTSFASSKGELTTITQYLYQSWTLDNCPSDFVAGLKHIAYTEMTHFSLLGELITQLGGNPIYRSFQYNRPILWNASMVPYYTTFTKVVHNNIASEQVAIDQYQQHITMIQDSGITAVLQRIIQDEQEHIEWFKRYQ